MNSSIGLKLKLKELPLQRCPFTFHIYVQLNELTSLKRTFNQRRFTDGCLW
jgi:hypothetical protein